MCRTKYFEKNPQKYLNPSFDIRLICHVFKMIFYSALFRNEPDIFLLEFHFIKLEIVPIVF